jgi:hypothetical protein
MTSHDESDSGWDFLADDLGIADKTETPPAKAEAQAERPATRPTSRPAPRLAPPPEEESDDFGLGIAEEPALVQGAMFDPGPDEVADEGEDLAGDSDDGDEVAGEEGTETGADGVKRRRRRRRRKKKGGPAEPAVAEAEDESVVEEGEAPEEVESDDDDEEVAPTALEEELEAEVVGVRQEWHVMTWAELVSKLHRPN